MSLTKSQVEEYRTLKDSGIALSKHNQIRFNEGSETSKHICAKSLTGLLGIRNGYRVDSEVDVQTRNYSGEIDVLLWGNPERLTYAIECETSPTRDTISQKVDQYVSETAVDDLQVVNVTKLPQNMTDALGYIGTTLGLEP